MATSAYANGINRCNKGRCKVISEIRIATLSLTIDALTLSKTLRYPVSGSLLAYYMHSEIWP